MRLVSLRWARSMPRKRSAVVTSLLLVRTAVADDSICQTRPRRCAMKSAPVDAVSELPLVPTNDAPICMSHSGGGGGGAAGGCAKVETVEKNTSKKAESARVTFIGTDAQQRPYHSRHSDRNASAGSVAAARPAGNAHAAAAMA